MKLNYKNPTLSNTLYGANSYNKPLSNKTNSDTANKKIIKYDFEKNKKGPSLMYTVVSKLSTFLPYSKAKDQMFRHETRIHIPFMYRLYSSLGAPSTKTPYSN